MSASLSIALAQTASIAGDVCANIEKHLAAARQAAAAGAQAVIFPELSLTGYEPGLVTDLAFTPDDPRLQPLRDAAAALNVVLVVGAPLRHASSKPQIAVWWLSPSGDARIQTKQYLHSGEEQAFSVGGIPAPFSLASHTLALAICADTTHAEHAAYAAQWQPGLYIASSMISEGGYAKDTAQLRDYALRHHMAVALVNHGAATGGWAAAGRSAVWDEQGALIAATPGPGEFLLLLQRDPAWRGEVHALV